LRSLSRSPPPPGRVSSPWLGSTSPLLGPGEAAASDDLGSAQGSGAGRSKAIRNGWGRSRQLPDEQYRQRLGAWPMPIAPGDVQRPGGAEPRNGEFPPARPAAIHLQIDRFRRLGSDRPTLADLPPTTIFHRGPASINADARAPAGADARRLVAAHRLSQRRSFTRVPRSRAASWPVAICWSATSGSARRRPLIFSD